ncbi:MAG: hybrid sensor histidine kinase/response regulator [Elusimicrobia bacterium]|nr:hybrid sensor histidine kinase/response regulator [Elusimicrobiota bacterium]
MAESESILIVDDEEGVLDICESALSLKGFKVSTARNGTQALKKLDSIWFDVVLTDLVMPPPTDGRELLQKVKVQRPGTDVIIMTASPTLETAIAALKEGAYDYLIKPFEMDYLQSVVGRCIQKRRDQRELAVERQLREELEAAYSELKKLEKLKEAFLARVSHELKTPLSEVVVALQVLEESLLPASDVKTKLQIAKDGAGRLQEIIEDLLSFVRVQKDDLELNKERVNLLELFKEITEEARQIRESKKISLAMDFPQEMPLFPGDKSLLKKALRHIFLNSVYFNREGGSVQIQAKVRERGIILSVKDTGEGIPEGQKMNVFDPFYQIAEYMTRKVGGMGLGLAITRRIIEVHGGAIEVESALGKGTTFKVYVPVDF